MVADAGVGEVRVARVGNRSPSTEAQEETRHVRVGTDRYHEGG